MFLILNYINTYYQKIQDEYYYLRKDFQTSDLSIMKWTHEKFLENVEKNFFSLRYCVYLKKKRIKPWKCTNF